MDTEQFTQQANPDAMRAACDAALDLEAALLSAPPCLLPGGYLNGHDVESFMACAADYFKPWHDKCAALEGRLADLAPALGAASLAPRMMLVSELNATANAINGTGGRPSRVYSNATWDSIRAHFASALNQASAIASWFRENVTTQPKQEKLLRVDGIQVWKQGEAEPHTMRVFSQVLTEWQKTGLATCSRSTMSEGCRKLGVASPHAVRKSRAGHVYKCPDELAGQIEIM